ncbi:MAG: hypothetical protein AVDCRST_MAG73-1367 [uncultured Thermomicrobiales bacterium]|uniref:Uncharacterized protein n=1 Tax=uncultured Thermomicrobiales bacterium TaxID=1645740 RepID=A0A6J4TYB3_9BACT|nr:MAG: hypothetical protein AVDCRST_MAG73-1367 [uncultured Thermomicrobiales bacterium]
MTAVTAIDQSMDTDTNAAGPPLHRDPAARPSTLLRPDKRPSTGADLLAFAGTWTGDDLEERLAEVIATRSQATF